MDYKPRFCQWPRYLAFTHRTDHSLHPLSLLTFLFLSPGIISSQSVGFGETKARCLGLGLLKQTSPEAGAQKGLASFVEPRAGKHRDKNTN